MNELLAVWKGSSFLCVVEAGVEAGRDGGINKLLEETVSN